LKVNYDAYTGFDEKFGHVYETIAFII